MLVSTPRFPVVFKWCAIGLATSSSGGVWSANSGIDEFSIYKLTSADHRTHEEGPKCDADLCIGIKHKYSKPSEAALIASDGQTIHIDAGEYIGDAAIWTQNDLTIRAVDGRAHIDASGVQVGGRAHGSSKAQTQRWRI